jgi:hypothetical protein
MGRMREACWTVLGVAAGLPRLLRVLVQGDQARLEE